MTPKITYGRSNNPHAPNNMPAQPYIPPRDGDFADWSANFNSVLVADPAAYGLTAPDVAPVTAAENTWVAAYTAAIDPATRTAPTVAAKDAARAALEAIVRPLSQTIALNAAVTPEAKTALGIRAGRTPPTPVPPPTTWPVLSLRAATPNQHVLAYTDSGAGTGKAKPAGAIGVQLVRSAGEVPLTDPTMAAIADTLTKSPSTVSTAGLGEGNRVRYWARWQTRSGPGGKAQFGPWSPPITVTVV